MLQIVGSRHWGVLAGASLYATVLAIKGVPLATVIILPCAWTLGLVLGARWRLIKWLVTLSNRPAPATGPEWGRALVGIVALTSITAMVIDYEQAFDLICACGPAIAMTYAIAKIGCGRLGCCSWGRTGGLMSRIPLQSLEAGISTVFAAMLLGASAVGINPIWQCFLAIGTHGSLRAFNRFARASAPRVPSP